MSRSIARLAGLLVTGLFAGFLLGILVLELSLRRFDGSVYVQTQQVTLVAIPVLAAVLLFPAIVATTILVLAQRRARGRAFGLVALALLLVALVVTLTINVPINLAEAQWTVVSPPADWAAARDRWQIGHAGRTVAALAAFVTLLLASPDRRTERG